MIIKAAWLASIQSQFILCFIEDDRWKRYLLKGLGNTIKMAIFAVIIGIIIGIIVAIVRSTHDKTAETAHKGFGRAILNVANGICRVYLTIIRGTPVIVQIMIYYYLIFASSNNGVLVGIIAFGINSGAYVAEIFRAGIMSIDNGQFEAGASLGLNYRRTMMFVILPQAFKNILPALANECIVLLKETSVAGYIALEDLTKGGDIIRSVTYEAFLPLIAVALIYLIIVVGLSSLVGKLEKRLKKNERDGYESTRRKARREAAEE